MDTAINGVGAPLTPTTIFTQTLVVGSQLPANGPEPPPATIPAAISDSNIKDTFTPSQQASVLISTTAPPAVPATSAPVQAHEPPAAVPAKSATSDNSPLAQFEQDQPPPPYTLERITRDANRADTQLTPPQPYSLLQLKQFSKLLTTLQSLTSAVLPSLSFSA